MNTRHTSIRTLALLALLAPVGCDDPQLMLDEELLLSDDPDEVDAAIDSALDQLNDEVDPAAVVYGSAASFSAVNKLSAVRSFGTTTAITVDAWVYLPAASTGVRVILDGGTGSTRFGLGENLGKLWIRKSGAWCDTGIPIPLNKWAHLAWTHDNATKTSKVYLNGILTTNICKRTDNVTSESATFKVGGETNGTYVFSGKIDQIRVWNVARSEADIQKLMLTSGSSVTASAGLKAYYKLDGSGADSASGGVALTVSGTPWSESKSPPVTGATFFNATTKRGYMASTTTATWSAAKTACTSNTGWNLVTINDATEDTYIDGTVLGNANTSRYWTGYNDLDNKSSYVWTNGEVSAYKDGAPALTKGQCMADNTLVSGVYDAWAPRLCTEANRYICEYRFL